jgi:hypothetical protein
VSELHAIAERTKTDREQKKKNDVANQNKNQSLIFWQKSQSYFSKTPR